MSTRLILLLGLLGLGACADSPGAGNASEPTSPLPVGVDALLVQTALPGTRAPVRGRGFLDGARIDVTLTGIAAGRELRMTLPAERLDDLTLQVAFPPSEMAAVEAGTFSGLLTVQVQLGEARGEAQAAVSFDVARELRPVLTSVPAGAFPASPFVLRGEGFIEGEEGRTGVDLRGRFRRERDGQQLPLELEGVPAVPARGAPGEPWSRDVASVVFEPGWLGIEPGTFEGEIRVVNAGPGWTRDDGWAPARFDLLPPVVERVQPLAASRGQRVTIAGQGFVGGTQGHTVLRLEGEFHPRDGEPVALPPGALEIAPAWIDGTALAFAMRVRFDFDCRSADLGGRPGRLVGRVVPVASHDGVTVEGSAMPIEFEVLPTRQVVWLKFLPAFTDSLREFGLRNYSAEVQARILEVLRRDYDGVNLEIRLTEPLDFLDYSVVEIGGVDPNMQNLFGLDNTPDLDGCNQRLDDNLAGRNADGAGYGGIFVESFLQLSARDGNGNPLASPLFDQIFDPVIGTPAEPGELPDGPRAEVIRRAIFTLGTLVGNTATHEIGHSLGLPVFPGCGQYHTAPGPMQVMDCGVDRPFEERAEVNGTGPAAFNPEDREYLQRILPLP